MLTVLNCNLPARERGGYDRHRFPDLQPRELNRPNFALPPCVMAVATPASPAAADPARTKSPSSRVRGSEHPQDAAAEHARRAKRFEQLVAAHHREVYGYLKARLLEPADAEDLTQEVFLRCISGDADFPEEAAPERWLMGVAKNVLREHIRHVTRRKEVAWAEMVLELDGLSAGEAQERQMLDLLAECFESLGQSAREALRLRYHEQLRLSEIGERLQRSEGAIKLLMYRARQALKRCLDFRLKAEDHA